MGRPRDITDFTTAAGTPVPGADLTAIPRTVPEIVGESMALAATLAGLGYTLAAWTTLPDRVPTHFTLAGRVDGWGSRNTLLLLPLAGVVVYALLTVLARFPRLFNYPVKVRPDDLPYQYRLARWFMTWIKASIATLFALLDVLMVAMARGGGAPAAGASRWLLVVVGVGLVGNLGLSLTYFARASGRRTRDAAVTDRTPR
jgi:hypothetical protein